MQATVMMSTKLCRRNSASALVMRPQEGQRIAPEVLRNILLRGDLRHLVLAGLGRDPIALVQPHAEIDQATGERAERSMLIAVPRGSRPARRTRHHRFDPTGH